MSLDRSDQSRRAGELPESVPPSGRAFQLIFWKVVETWQQEADRLVNWDDCLQLLADDPDDWTGLTRRLQLINAYQWREEDKSRDPDADDTVLANVKRSIDASNQRRVAAIEAFDRLLHTNLSAAGLLTDDAELQSESPGSIVDRLTVLALRIHYLKQRLLTARQQPGSPVANQVEDPELTEYHHRLRSVTEQMVDLTECLDRYLAAIAAGTARFKVYGHHKLYRQPQAADDQ
ncbi:MAG: DUF4254 domain-containing protein [bacterium]